MHSEQGVKLTLMMMWIFVMTIMEIMMKCMEDAWKIM